MSCCDRVKIERLKVYDHAAVLACQTAHLTKVKMAIVKQTHNSYGEYYEGIEYEKAKDENRKILQVYNPTDKWKKKPKFVAAVLD
jgi:hypothetical protein